MACRWRWGDLKSCTYFIHLALATRQDGSGNTQIVENACYIQPASAGPSRMTILLATKPFTLHFLKMTLLTHQTLSKFHNHIPSTSASQVPQPASQPTARKPLQTPLSLQPPLHPTPPHHPLQKNHQSHGTRSRTPHARSRYSPPPTTITSSHHHQTNDQNPLDPPRGRQRRVRGLQRRLCETVRGIPFSPIPIPIPFRGKRKEIRKRKGKGKREEGKGKGEKKVLMN